tara:strand:- start:4257 stop:4631 length:375 start_codon:yes stop_codon:yes gene_type:complete
MDGKERLYYALGQLAYAVAKADGEVNYEEKNKLHDIMVAGIKSHKYAFNITEIIFHILQKDKFYKVDDAYEVALSEIDICSNYLTEEMKIEFIEVLEKVAAAFGTVTTEEKAVINRFKADLAKF